MLVADTRVESQFLADSAVSEATRIRIEPSNAGCPADSPTIFCASVSAWLNILYESPPDAHGALDPDSSFFTKRNMIQAIGAVTILNTVPRIQNFTHFLYSPFATRPAAFLAFLFQLRGSGSRTYWILATSVFFREPKLLVNDESGSSSKYLYVLMG